MKPDYRVFKFKKKYRITSQKWQIGKISTQIFSVKSSSGLVRTCRVEKKTNLMLDEPPLIVNFIFNLFDSTLTGFNDEGLIDKKGSNYGCST
jgi:hypothetical protein